MYAQQGPRPSSSSLTWRSLVARRLWSQRPLRHLGSWIWCWPMQASQTQPHSKLPQQRASRNRLLRWPDDGIELPAAGSGCPAAPAPVEAAAYCRCFVVHRAPVWRAPSRGNWAVLVIRGIEGCTGVDGQDFSARGCTRGNPCQHRRTGTHREGQVCGDRGRSREERERASYGADATNRHAR